MLKCNSLSYFSSKIAEDCGMSCRMDFHNLAGFTNLLIAALLLLLYFGYQTENKFV